MTDSFHEQLSRLRSKPACEPEEVGELVVAAGSIEALLRVLLKDPRPGDRPIVIPLIRYLTLEHREHQGLSVSLIVCAFLLANYGDYEDCVLIWQARMANFSTFSGLSDVLLVGAGVEETLRFLRQKSARRWSIRRLFRPELPDERTGSQARAVKKHIERSLKAGRLANREAKLAGIEHFCRQHLVKTA